jgi:hypothetical protein
VSISPTRSPVVWVMSGEAAEMLGIHINTLKRIPPAELPYMRANARGDRRYLRTDVKAYIERRMVR